MSGNSPHSQFSLFESRELFEPETLERARAQWATTTIHQFNSKIVAAAEFVESVKKIKGKINEEDLEQQFNQAFFSSLLGYALYPGINSVWSGWPKTPSAATRLSGTPDILLGQFSPENFTPVIAVELKKPNTNLDAPQGSYGGITPVEQAFGYARSLGTCRWVCVSNMRHVRLYSVDDPRAYHELDLWDVSKQESIFKELWHLLSFENVAETPRDSPTWRLLLASRDAQVAFQEGFYSIYSEIREDIIREIGGASGDLDRPEVVQAAQRLLDRLIFIHFCEDHPDRLLKRNILKDVVESAVRQPGSSRTKAYEALKGLFHDLDVGADTGFWEVPRYNGELFKAHRILDSISLPDSLHSKRYQWQSPDSRQRRTVQGAYGLHIFDFWKELDRDLLGNIFERSISDLTAIAEGGRPDARSAFGIYYTAGRLARFAAQSAVAQSLSEDNKLQELLSAGIPKGGELSRIEGVVSHLQNYRIADIACGSGVFLVAAFESLLGPFRKALEASGEGALVLETLAFKQSEVLKRTIFGCDLLPQAVELAKLSLWLTAARRNEPSADLTTNFVTGDSLTDSGAAELARRAGGQFDILVGNPPWGAEVESPGGLSGLDSWEVFLRHCESLLRPGGRLCLILPDTIFSPMKESTRRWLAEHFEIEKLYSLGPDWFTNKVRMGTVMLQCKKGASDSGHAIQTLLLAGQERTESQQGLRPLEQAEATGFGIFKQQRTLCEVGAPLSPLIDEQERPLLDKIFANSVPLSSLAMWGRGEEMSASGLFWECGNCHNLTVPGAKKKGGGYHPKRCPQCQALQTEQNVERRSIVSPEKRGPFDTPFIDGDSLTRRYQNPSRKYLRTDLKTIPSLKRAELYEGTRILIRQAGVGITATMVNDGSRVPQSIYLYWSNDQARTAGYSEEFLLACLVSRISNFIHMKRTGEVEPARAFSKVTHERLGAFPIPKLSTFSEKQIAADISALVQDILREGGIGGEIDWAIESKLRQLWQISGDEGRYVNGFFSVVPEGQMRRDLFPSGPPSRIPFPHRE